MRKDILMSQKEKILQNYRILQAAATITHSMRQSIPPPVEALKILKDNHPETRQVLAKFGTTHRQLPKRGIEKPLQGEKIVLYKALIPSEQQAKLSYEYLLDEFSKYLQRKICAVVLSESAAHTVIWLPEGVKLELEKQWQDFVTEMTGPSGFSKGFGLVMNVSKLSDRGFSTLETPMASSAQPEAVAAFYLANLRHVEKRINQRQNTIEHKKELLAQEANDKKRNSLEKQLIKDQQMQAKELEKYSAEFEKMFGRLLQKELDTHKELIELEVKTKDADAKQLKKLQKQQEKLKLEVVFTSKIAKDLKSIYQPNAFSFMKSLSQDGRFATKWLKAEQTAKRYNQIAANQLSTQKGDIYGKIIWETCVLLYGKTKISPLEPLLRDKSFVWSNRLAGDNQSDFCYSCGRVIDKNSRFRSRRLLFESPEQRTQSGGSSSPVQICTTCAALSILSPVKFAPDTLIIRFNVSELDVENRVKQALEQQALNEMGATAGRYINITCTEKQSDGTLASQKLGLKQYATAKLASLYPINILRFLRPVLYVGGQEIPLQSSVLVGVTTLMKAFQQSIKDSNEINLKLGEAIRLVENNEFVKASYTLSRVRSYTQTRILEDGTKIYKEALEKEEGMQNHVEVLADVHAMVGLLMPFCRQILARTDLKMDESTKWREVGKLIQSIDEHPTVFSYNTSKIVGGVGNLVRDYNTHFVFDKAKQLLEKLDNIPPYADKDGNVENDSDKIRVTNDLIAKAYEYILGKELYKSDYNRKNFFYQVKLGLYARFPEAR